MLYYLFLALSFYTEAGTPIPLSLVKMTVSLQADNAMKINVAKKILSLGLNRISQAESQGMQIILSARPILLYSNES
jgi:hypothetical protein